MTIQFDRCGVGKPLILVHGLGSTRNAWTSIVVALATDRELIMLDLPGHGESPAEDDSGTFDGLARSFEEWLVRENLAGLDMVGSSMGARLVLEMARRGRSGAVISLDPGGFWQGWERTFVKTTLSASGKLLRSLRPALPKLSRSAIARTLLLAQLAARPWALNGKLVGQELQSIANTPTFDALVQDLAFGAPQKGPAAGNAVKITIGWGRHDRLCFPAQAERAQKAFPGSNIVWFERSGHFPMWEQPEDVVRLILDNTS